MKRALPLILRKGAIVRVADEREDSLVSAWSVTYVDLRFDDGHVERLTGAGWLHEGPLSGLEAAAALVEWGEETLLDQTGSLLAGLGIEFSIGRAFAQTTRDHLAAAPIEIVIERHARPTQSPRDLRRRSGPARLLERPPASRGWRAPAPAAANQPATEVVERVVAHPAVQHISGTPDVPPVGASAVLLEDPVKLGQRSESAVGRRG